MTIVYLNIYVLLTHLNGVSVSSIGKVGSNMIILLFQEVNVKTSTKQSILLVIYRFYRIDIQVKLVLLSGR